jgi:ABC-type phosphate transport system auxiliary subunit
MNKKILSLSLVVIVGILIVVGFLGFKYWPTPWKEYRNQEYGISFKYPANWEFKESAYPGWQNRHVIA